jgi:hypothetical protein
VKSHEFLEVASIENELKLSISQFLQQDTGSVDVEQDDGVFGKLLRERAALFPSYDVFHSEVVGALTDLLGVKKKVRTQVVP